MQSCPADIISRLQKEILSLQGYKPVSGSLSVSPGLAPVRNAFPDQQIPLSTIHEFICPSPESFSATNGFITALLSSLMQKGGACLWISSSHKTFPAALPLFGVLPQRIIFVHVPKEKDVLWATEEALKCNGLAAVIAETKELSFTASRRLQLAAEKSHVTGFLLRPQPKMLTPNVCSARWVITPVPGELPAGMPGIGFPGWKVELLKVRNGKPGQWQLEWNGKTFNHIIKQQQLPEMLHKKTG